MDIETSNSSELKPINRDVGKQSSGFFYQKQRAVVHILEALEVSKEFYFAVEFLDDVYGEIYSGNNSVKILEQDKEYDKETKFTINSSEVYKSIINFLEKWLDGKRSEQMQFLFVSTNKIGTERESGAIKQSGVTLSNTPVLEKICNREYSNDEALLQSYKKIIIYRYKQLYENSLAPHLSEIESLTDAEWKRFLDKIYCFFEAPDTCDIKDEAIEKIKKSILYNEHCHKGTEKQIYNSLILSLEEKQGKPYPAKFITTPEVREIFRELSLPLSKKEDPYWKAFDDIKREDLRGLEEKITSVTSAFNIVRLNTLKRKVANSALEENDAVGNSFKAQKYRVFDACCDLLEQKLGTEEKACLSEEEIFNIIDELVNSSEGKLLECAKSYDYPYNNKETIKGMILNLFNECYLAFDSVEKK